MHKTDSQAVTDFRKVLAWVNFINLAIILLTFILPGLFNIKHIRVMKYIQGFFFLIFMRPTYVIIFTIYAACNIHDISWGNRTVSGKNIESLTPDEKKKIEE